MTLVPVARAGAEPADLAPARIEGWLASHRRRVVACLVGAAAFVRLLLCLQVAAGPLPRIHAIISASDNHFFDEWGRRLAAGDWWQRAPLHPMPDWMVEVAEQAQRVDPHLTDRLLPGNTLHDHFSIAEKLWDRWLGGPTFFQEPAYPYLIGLTYRLAGADVWHVFAWQLALGIAGMLLVYALALRLFSRTAAVVSAALHVLAPIPLVFEVTLLRDSLVVFATLALALLMCWAPEGGGRRWLVLGLAFGAAALVKQSFLFFPLLMALWRWTAVRAPLRQRAVAAGLVIAGMAIALSPAILRNVVVGVPAFAFNGSAHGMLALFHTAHSAPFGLVLPPEYSRILVATDGRLLPSLIEAARTHASGWGIVALNARKLLYSWHSIEIPNNVDFYLFRQASSLLAVLPVTFAVLVPLAAIGAATKRFQAAWPLFVAVLGNLSTMVLASVLSRYRAPVTAALMPLAGAGLVRLASWTMARRWIPLGVAAAASAIYLAWALASPTGLKPLERAGGYFGAGEAALAHGEWSFAALQFQEALRLAPEVPEAELGLGFALLQKRDPDEALPHLAAAVRALGLPGARVLHARALMAVNRRDEAAAELRSALAAEPGRVDARKLLEALERGPDMSASSQAAP